MGDFDAGDYDKSRTLFCGNLHHSVTEDLLYELFLQGGPIQKVFIPKSKTGGHRNFGFITYYHPISVPYAIEIFAETALFNRRLSLKPSGKAKSNERPEEHVSAQKMERNTNMLQYSNDALRQLGSVNSIPINCTSNMEPTMNVNPLSRVIGNPFDPMMLLAMGANLLSGLSNSFGMPQSQQSNSSSARSGNSDNFKMKNDRSHSGSNNNEPYNKTAHHNRHDRNRDNDRDRYDRGGRDWRDNRNNKRR